MASTLKEVLEQLEKTGQAPVEVPTPATLEVAPVEPQVDENTEHRKLAEEYDAAGRIMAFAFADELQKIAVGTVGMTVNTGEIPENPAVELSRTDVDLGNVEKVVSKLRAITQGAEGNYSPAGKVEALLPTVESTEPSNQIPPVAYDAAKAQQLAAAEAAVGQKRASTAVDVLYQHYFGN